LARLVDDAALFPPGNAAMPDAVRGHLAGRAGERAGVMGLFLCTASRLPELITELIKARPAKPVGLSLVVDTGLGGLPKAVSIVESRAELLALRMVEMPAPSDVDDVWLERVDEFVPEDAIRVIEPRRGGPDWLAGVRRVADRGYWPKLRCGGQVFLHFAGAGIACEESRDVTREAVAGGDLCQYGTVAHVTTFQEVCGEQRFLEFALASLGAGEP